MRLAASRIIAAIILTAIAVVDSAYAASIKEVNALQERCEKKADEKHTRYYGDGIAKDGSGYTGYTDHYNTKLNKCFYLESATGYAQNKDGKKSSFAMETLFDIDENKACGTYYKVGDDAHPFTCNIKGRICQSRKEWRKLLKPYMEE
jgi:hypothetical protein